MVGPFAQKLNETREPGVYYVCALLHDETALQLYRVATNDPLVIVRECHVGEHGTDPDVVENMLRKIHAWNPIIPHVADPATFECAFEKPITPQFAAFLDDTVIEGLEAYAEEDDGGVGELVRRDGCLRLWWD